MGIETGTALLIGTLVTSAAAVGSAILGKPEDMQLPQVKPPVLDKTGEQEKEVLKEVQIGDEESRKRKQQTSKEKFRVDLGEPETGLKLPEKPNTIPGVQI